VAGLGQRALARAAIASWRIPGFLYRAGRALVNGIWLGLLSDAGLRALDERYYDGETTYRTDAWNERGLFDWERELVDEHFAAGGRIAVPACGGGREVLALLGAGYDATGYESHPGLAAYGNGFLAEREYPDRVRAVDRDSFPEAVGACDGVVVGWQAFSLLHGHERRVAFLAGARRSLAGDGPVLLSFFSRDGDSRELRWTAGIAGAIPRPGRWPPVELGDTLAPNRVHVFSRAEIEAELAAAGFALAEYRTLGRADENTTYAAAVGRAA
jgi:SAM-dependent methyltransferase